MCCGKCDITNPSKAETCLNDCLYTANTPRASDYHVTTSDTAHN